MSAERQTVLPGWQRKRLSDLYAAPSRNGLYKPALHYGDGHQMVHMPQMFRGPIVDISDAARVKVSPVELSRFGLQEGDLLFARRSLTLEGAGQCSLVPPLSQPATFESSIIRVRVDQQLISPRYANFFLGSAIGFRRRLPFIKQVAVSGVSGGDVAAISIDFPSLPHQQKITTILSTVDEAIEQTEALIAKYQQIKAGLMHDLFTRGVTPDGHLRPPQSEAPHLYKQSPLGWIPKEWDIPRYEDVCDRVSVGIATSTTNQFAESGVPILRNQNIRAGRIDLVDVLKINREFDALNKSKRLRTGDVITARTGYPGTSAVVPPDLEGWQTFTTLISTPNKHRVTSEFLCELLNSHVGKAQIARLQGGGAQQNLNVGWLVNLTVPLPHMSEQVRIATSLHDAVTLEDVETAHLAKLHQQQQGLMHDLLTGRVPVTGEMETVS